MVVDLFQNRQYLASWIIHSIRTDCAYDTDSSEMMLCDFSPLQLISSRHIKSTPMTIPLKDRSPVPTPRTPIGPLPITSDYIDFLRISGRFDHYPGMMQVQLDLAHFVSLYDEKLAPSLSTVREGKPRLRHRLLGMSQEDILRVKLHLEEQIAEVAWSSLECAGNHLDWSTHLHSIVDLYGDTFEDLWYIINSTISLSPADVRAENAFRMIESIVRPFVLHSVSPTGTSPDIAWASSVFKECALSHASAVSAISFTNSEELLRNAIEGTTRELCRVMTKMWTDGVHEGMSPLFGSTHKPEDATFLLDTWKVDLGNLIDWLDWGTWMRCRPACKQLVSSRFLPYYTKIYVDHPLSRIVGILLSSSVAIWRRKFITPSRRMART